MPSSDYKVEIVTDSGQADMSVTVIGDQVVDLSSAQPGQTLVVQPDGTVAPGFPNPPAPLYELASGNWATGLNHLVGSPSAFTTQALRLRYFTARSATPVNSLATYCEVVGSTDASLARMGIWSLGANGSDLAALLASSLHDPALWRTLGKRTVALTSAFTPVVGTRYAVGALVVQASGTLPSLASLTGLTNTTVPLEDVPANGQLTGQADLPASSSAITSAGTGPYVELVP